MSEHFEWIDNSDIAVRTQMAIAVFLNRFGDLVIRQESQFHPDEDAFVQIAMDNVPAVIAAIQRVVSDRADGETVEVMEDDDGPPSASPVLDQLTLLRVA